MRFPKLPTEGIGQIILAVWIIFSVVFVANNVWQNFQVNQVQQAAGAGYQQAVVDLVKQAETCEAFPINIGETAIELQKVGC
jgi:predicted negative regulator of RcsB-dependent stress response